MIVSYHADGGMAHRALADWLSAHVDYTGPARAIVERAAKIGRRTRGSSPSLTWDGIREQWPSMYPLASALDYVATAADCMTGEMAPCWRRSRLHPSRHYPSRGALP